MSPAIALVPLGAGLLAAFVAIGRWRIAPLEAVARKARLRTHPS
jgi:hypothetical protein